jgi:hypothetical protein
MTLCGLRRGRDVGEGIESERAEWPRRVRGHIGSAAGHHQRRWQGSPQCCKGGNYHRPTAQHGVVEVSFDCSNDEASEPPHVIGDGAPGVLRVPRTRPSRDDIMLKVAAGPPELTGRQPRWPSSSLLLSVNFDAYRGCISRPVGSVSSTDS